MHKDFHLYGTYLAARLAGRNAEHAKATAFAAQATDDFTYSEYAVCQSPCAMITEDMNVLKTYWSTFHFLPSGIGTPLTEERMYITGPEGLLFNKLLGIANGLREKNDRLNLAYLGIIMHIIADTFSHKGFSGIPSKFNIVEHLIMCEKQGLGAVGTKNAHVPVFFAKHFAKAAIGHGTAGNAPDLSWVSYTYIDFDCSGNVTKARDNAVTFAEAFVTLYKALGGELKYSNDIKEKVKSVLYGIRNAVDKNKKESYYIENDRSFENMLRQNTLKNAAHFSEKITPNEIKELTEEYEGYLNEVNRLAKDFSQADKDSKTDRFRALERNDFFAAAIAAREAIMSEIDEGFKAAGI